MSKTLAEIVGLFTAGYRYCLSANITCEKELSDFNVIPTNSWYGRVVRNVTFSA